MSEDELRISTRSPRPGLGWKTWQVAKVVQARLRFIAVLAAVGLVIGYWDNLNNYYEKWSRPLYGQKGEVESDVEYFCPMHPAIVRPDNKEKCPICHMDLAKRKKGTDEAEPLAAGTVSRVQLTPYRVVLAGVRTVPVRSRILSRHISAFGSVEFNEAKLSHIATRQKGRIVKLFANFTGQRVKKGEKLAVLDVRYDKTLMLTLDELRRAREYRDPKMEGMARRKLRLWDIDDKQIEDFLRSGEGVTEMVVRSPQSGHVIKKYQREGGFVEDGTPLYDVADLDSVWIEAQVYESDQALLQVGQRVQATTLALPNQVFDGTLDFIYPHLDEGTRSLTVRFHIPNKSHRLRPGMYTTVQVEIPPARIVALSNALAQQAAEENAIDALARAVAAPAGLNMPAGLSPLIQAAGGQAMLQSGLILAVPDSAIIDTGSLQIVYREAESGVYEGVAVQLGPRLTEPGSTVAWYPVLRGLREGENIVTNGSFLIDAETRLNPASGSIYFGGGGKSESPAVAVRPSTPPDEDAEETKIRTRLATLSSVDRKLAQAQKYCPVQRSNRLGSMGPPVKVIVENRPVFLCCKGCASEAKASPRKTLEFVEKREGRR